MSAAVGVDGVQYPVAVTVWVAWDGEGEWSGTSGVICRAAYGVAIETGAIDGGEGVGVMGRDGVGLGGCA